MKQAPSPISGISEMTVPQTEGVKYIGSKLKLLRYILQLTHLVDAKTILDGFSGTTRVSQALAKSGYQVTASDISVWSEIFGTCYLCNTREKKSYKELIDHLNAVPPLDGWFTDNYGGYSQDGISVQNDGLKKPWQIHNTRKLDGIREEIDRLSLTKIERAVALTSLILALDAVDNTLGHFTSYLNQWSVRSYNELHLHLPEMFVSEVSHRIIRGDIFETLDQISVDLAYFDPPYGSNNEKMPPSRVRYAAYYHLWTTICLNDKPELFGKAKRRTDSSDLCAESIFENYRRNEKGRFIAVEAINQLLQRTNAKWIILSYSSGGRATANELEQVLRSNGKILATIEIEYKRNAMSNMTWTNNWCHDVNKKNREFLFLIEKN